MSSWLASLNLKEELQFSHKRRKQVIRNIYPYFKNRKIESNFPYFRFPVVIQIIKPELTIPETQS